MTASGMLIAPCDRCGAETEWSEPDPTLPRACANCEHWDDDAGWYRVGDTVEFLGTQYADLTHGQRGTIAMIEPDSVRPIRVQFDGIDRLIPCSVGVLSVLRVE